MSKSAIAGLLIAVVLIAGGVFLLLDRESAPIPDPSPVTEALEGTPSPSVAGAEPASDAPSPAVAQETHHESAQSSPGVEPEPAGGLPVSGTVFFPDGSPAPGSAVSVVASPLTHYGVQDPEELTKGEAVTGDDGTFSLALHDAPEGFLIVFARMEGYANASHIAYTATNMPYPEEVRRTEGLELRLRQEAPLAGRLIHGDGTPAAGYSLQYTQMLQRGDTMAVNQSPEEGFPTGDDGQFTLPGLEEGQVMIAAFLDESYIHSWTESAPNEALVLTIPRADRTLSGRVFREGSGFAIAGADLILERRQDAGGGIMIGRVARAAGDDRHEAVSGTGGSFSFEGLRPGLYALNARHRGDRLGMLRFEVEGGEAATDHGAPPMMQNLVQVPEDGGDVEASIYLYSGDRVHGRVIKSGTDEPVGDVTIRLGPHSMQRTDAFGDPFSERTTVTDEEGRFSVSSMFHSGQLQLTVDHPGLSLTSAESPPGQSIYFMPGDRGQGRASLHLPRDGSTTEREVLVRMSSELTISGVVRRASGEPLHDAMVSFHGAPNDGPWSFSPIADSEAHSVTARGEFTIPVASNSEGSITVRTEAIKNLRSDLITVGERSVTGIEIVAGEPGSIAGQVVDAEGRAFPRATVTLTPSIRIGSARMSPAQYAESAQSDADGRFRFENLGDGQYSLRATAEGVVPSDIEWRSLAPGEHAAGVTLTLHAGISTRIRVVNEAESPIAGAMVRAMRQRGGMVSQSGQPPTTDENGRVTLDGLPQEPLQLNISATGYEQFYVSSFEPSEEEQVFTLSETRVRRLTVFVVDAETNGPVGGFEVSSRHTYGGNRQVNLDIGDGYFIDSEFQRYHSVNYTITHDRYADAQLQVYFGEEDFEKEETVRLYRGTALTGRVVDRDSREPIPGTTVEFFPAEVTAWDNVPPANRTTTDEDGRFRFDSVTGGRATVQVRPGAPYTTRREPVTVTGSSTQDMGDIELGSGGAIRVTVMRSGQPVPGQGVHLTGFSSGSSVERRGLTEDDGTYTFTGLPYATYNLTVGSTQANVEQVRDGDIRDVTINLGSASLELTVNYGGRPTSALGSYNLHLRSAIHGTPAIHTQQRAGQDTFRYENLPAGSYTLDAQRTTAPNWLHLPAVATFELRDGEQRRETVSLPAGEIRGTIKDPEGNPVRNASLDHRALNDGANAGSHVQTPPGQQGRIHVTMLQPGRHWLRATHPDLGSAEEIFEVGEDQVLEDVELVLGESPAGTLVSIALRLSDGEPIRNAWLRIRAEDGRDYSPAQNTPRDSDGALTVEDLPPGEYNVEVSAWGHSVGRHRVTITANETAYIDDVLYEAGSMRWTLTEADGSPIAGAETRLIPLDPETIETARSGQTDNAGQWNDRGLYPGNYRAEATLPDGTVLTASFVITAHEHTEETTAR